MKMKPLLYNDFITDLTIYPILQNNVPWINNNAPRMECLMSDVDRSYSYGKAVRHYTSVKFHRIVEELLHRINTEFGTEYNVCFLNYYENDKKHLGWHADEFEGADDNHPIGVVSFGQSREIWVKEKGSEGVIPASDRYMLHDGSLFIMPAGFQQAMLHKIPKGDRPMGGRISLTYRKFL